MFRIFKTRNLLLDKVPRILDHVVWKDIGKSLIVALNLKSGLFYTFEGLHAEIWQLCDGNSIARLIVQKVQGKVPNARNKDVAKFIEKLLEEELICVERVD